MKKIYNDYLNDKIKFNKKEIVTLFSLIIVFSGVFGFIYEYIFYYFNFGMNKFYWQGGNFLPFINIYAYGAVAIILLTKKYRKSPLKVFLIGVISSGILEYFSGLVIYKLLGVRYWDYNTEILNFGNIGGFICLRSVLFFGISGLMLIYVIVPLFTYLIKKTNINILFIISIIILTIFMIDEIYNLIIARVFSLPRATSVYRSLGMNIMPLGK